MFRGWRHAATAAFLHEPGELSKFEDGWRLGPTVPTLPARLSSISAHICEHQTLVEALKPDRDQLIHYALNAGTHAPIDEQIGLRRDRIGQIASPAARGPGPRVRRWPARCGRD
jgi:hypothetical protein